VGECIEAARAPTTRLATTLSQLPKVGTNHHRELETVGLPWNGTTYLPEAEAQRATGHHGGCQNEALFDGRTERPEELLQDQGPLMDRTARTRDTPGKRRTEGPCSGLLLVALGSNLAMCCLGNLPYTNDMHELRDQQSFRTRMAVLSHQCRWKFSL